MLDNLHRHQTFMATLLLPLVLLAALADGRIHSITQGLRAGSVNTLAIWRR